MTSRPPFLLIDQFIPGAGDRVLTLAANDRRRLACLAAVLAIRVGGQAGAEYAPSLEALRAAAPDQIESARAREQGTRLHNKSDELYERVDAGDVIDEELAEALFRHATIWDAIEAALKPDVDAAAAGALYCAIYAVGDNGERPVEVLLDAVLAGADDPVALAAAAVEGG